MKTYPKKRVEIIAEASLLPRLLAAIKSAGAKGYTVLHDVSGEGASGSRTSRDDLLDLMKNVQIVVIADPAVAERVVEACAVYLEDYGETITLSDVEVLRPDHF